MLRDKICVLVLGQTKLPVGSDCRKPAPGSVDSLVLLAIIRHVEHRHAGPAMSNADEKKSAQAS